MSERDSQSTSSDPLEPVAASGGRIASLDFIRGIAVMGILAANIFSMGQPPTAYAFPGAFTVPHSDAEDWMWVAQFVLIDGKMYGMFALLFGAGLYLFMEKAWEKGATLWLQVKRLLWLGLFGLLHFYLLWQGDILFLYAASGLCALLFIALSARKQLVLGALGYVAGALFLGSTMTFMQQVADNPTSESAALAQVQADFLDAMEEDLADGRVETTIRQDGSYLDYVTHTVEQHGFEPLATLLLFPFDTLPLMLLGMVLYRKGFFTGGLEAQTLKRWGWAGLVFGAALSLAIALATKAGGLTYYGTTAAIGGWSQIPRLSMVLGLAALLVVHTPRSGSWFGERVSAAGRAAFTNYLGTSLVMLLVFGNWGLDLFGKFGRSELYLFVVAAWIGMLAWSLPWLARFRYGPLEWVWRCLTYGKLFALRR